MSELDSNHKYCIIAAVNNDNILANNLEKSILFEKSSHYLMRNYSSASKAYNNGIVESKAEILIFAHQDVYFPYQWEDKLRKGISEIEKNDPNWGVIGVYGIDSEGQHVGHCWSTGLGKIIGSCFSFPKKVVSIDELVIVLRRSTGLRFDENLPGFHLYGTDIVQTAISFGFSAYVINAPVIHNSHPVLTLRGGYQKAYNYMRKKWRNNLPICTVIVTITKFGWPLIRKILRMKINSYVRTPKNISQPIRTGCDIAKTIGFE